MENVEVPQDINKQPYNPTIPLAYTSKSNENRLLKRYLYSCIYCSIIHNSQYGNNLSFCQWANIWRCRTYNGSLKDTGLNWVGPPNEGFTKVFTLNMYYGTVWSVARRQTAHTDTNSYNSKLYVGIHAPNSISFKGQLCIQWNSLQPWGGKISCHLSQCGWVWEHYAKWDKSKTMTYFPSMWNLKKKQLPSNLYRELITDWWLPEVYALSMRRWSKGTSFQL